MFDMECSDPLDLVREGLARLAAEDRSTWSSAARSDRLLELHQVGERLEAETIRCAAVWDAVGAWAEDSALSAPAWLAARAKVSRPAAVRLMRSARLVREHDATAAALAAGVVSVAHVESLALAAHDRGELYAEHEPVLLNAAEALSPQDFHAVARRWRELADDELSRTEAAAAFERRAFQVSETTGGSVLSGFLDPEASAIVTQALDALAPPDPVGAPDAARSRSQRRADALVLLCQGSAGGSGESDDSSVCVTRPAAGVDVVIDYDTLVRRPPADLGTRRCEVEGFGPIARVTAERLLCDCAVARVIMRGKSQVLDYGRRTRIAPKHLRRLVALRDGHCQFPGCRAPVAWCDVHHLRSWLEGGGDQRHELCAGLPSSPCAVPRRRLEAGSRTGWHHRGVPPGRRVRPGVLTSDGFWRA